MPASDGLEIASPDARSVGGARHVAAVAREHVTHVSLLEYGHRPVARDGERQLLIDDLLNGVGRRGRGAAARARRGPRQLTERDLSCNGVAQLADVPRPVVVLQPIRASPP